jgi:hypothetical protein
MQRMQRIDRACIGIQVDRSGIRTLRSRQRQDSASTDALRLL